MPKISDNVLAEMVAQVRAGDEQAEERLYLTMRQIAKYWIVQHLGPQEYEDILHDTYLVVLVAVRSGDLHTPAAVICFIRTVVHRKIAQQIRGLVTRRKGVNVEECFNYDGSAISSVLHSKDNPEKEVEMWGKSEIMAEELGKMNPREQEILRRFYLDEQPWPEICEAMNLTDTTFRLKKSRAKQKLETAIAKRLQYPRPQYLRARAA